MLEKKGMTLVELLVAMSIFVIVMTLASGVFVTVSRVAIMTTTKKETNQKMRIAIEMITRYARQANKVIIPETGPTARKKMTLVFTEDHTATTSSTFEIMSTGELNYKECFTADPIDGSCPSGEPVSIDLLGGSFKLDSTSSFTREFNNQPVLNVLLIRNDLGTDIYFSDAITINNSVILENLN